MSIKKTLKQVSFLVANRSNIEQLASVRLQILGVDLIQLQNKMLHGLVLIGVAVVLFFVALMYLLLGLNEIVTSRQVRLWLFFGGSGAMLFSFLLIIWCALASIRSSVKAFQYDLQQIKEEIALLMGQLGVEQVENHLKTALNTDNGEG